MRGSAAHVNFLTVSVLPPMTVLSVPLVVAHFACISAYFSKTFPGRLRSGTHAATSSACPGTVLLLVMSGTKAGCFTAHALPASIQEGPSTAQGLWPFTFTPVRFLIIVQTN